MKWANLNPKAKRGVVIVGAVAAVSMLIALLPNNRQSGGSTDRPRDAIRHVLTDRDTRTIGLESLAASLKDLQNKASEQARRLQKIERDQEQSRNQRGAVPPVVDSHLERLSSQIEQLKEQIEQRQSEQAPSGESGTAPGDESEGVSRRREGSEAAGGSYGAAFDGGSTYGFEDLTQQNPLDIFQGARLPTSSMGDGGSVKSRSKGAPAIKVVMEEKVQARQQAEKEVEETFFMPAGSIITGVLLNGMDAPTGQGARNDLFPATLRVQKEAILPNRFRADIRECFIVISGYGDLSSERAYLRAETLSCVREDGAVIEAALNAYAVGEDGKAGVRGRLVSKQGQVIARSLMAGFLSGLSKAFDVKPVAVLDTSNSGSTQFQRNEPNADWLRSAAASGASTALEKVADFYLKMAEGMFPVIEVDAGRQVDLIINKGAKMQFRAMGVQK